MRRVFTILTAFVLLLGALAVGMFTADLPFWVRAMHLPLEADEDYLPVVAIGEAGGAPQPPSADVTAPAAQVNDTAAAAPVDLADPAVPIDTVAAVVKFENTALESAVTRARNAGSRALLVLRGGDTVIARYFGADDDRSLLPAGLIARPVTAMTIGLALADGSLASLDEPVARFLPEWADEARGRVTVRQLLEDTSGLETGGNTRGLLYRSPWKDLARLPAFGTSKSVRLLLGNDFAGTALRFDLEHEPGGFFNASPANPQLAAVILERVTGIPYERFVDERLWRAIGGGRAQLSLDRRAGMPAAHCCWRATGPDISRVLSLLATSGVHGGRQVLPSAWVQEMARASRVSAGSAMQLSRLYIDSRAALCGSDDHGSMFWVIPERALTIVNIVNPEGASPPELPGLLLQALSPG
jgi:CubicO group peptidase (beta-lactamase class C family)